MGGGGGVLACQLVGPPDSPGKSSYRFNAMQDRNRRDPSRVATFATILVARGGSPLENLIRVDGFETPTLSHCSTVGSAGGVVTLLKNELIADATFLAGGFPAEYGDRLRQPYRSACPTGTAERFR